MDKLLALHYLLFNRKGKKNPPGQLYDHNDKVDDNCGKHDKSIIHNGFVSEKRRYGKFPLRNDKIALIAYPSHLCVSLIPKVDNIEVIVLDSEKKEESILEPRSEIRKFKPDKRQRRLSSSNLSPKTKKEMKLKRRLGLKIELKSFDAPGSIEDDASSKASDLASPSPSVFSEFSAVGSQEEQQGACAQVEEEMDVPGTEKPEEEVAISDESSDEEAALVKSSLDLPESIQQAIEDKTMYVPGDVSIVHWCEDPFPKQICEDDVEDAWHAVSNEKEKPDWELYTSWTLDLKIEEAARISKRRRVFSPEAKKQNPPEEPSDLFPRVPKIHFVDDVEESGEVTLQKKAKNLYGSPHKVPKRPKQTEEESSKDKSAETEKADADPSMDIDQPSSSAGGSGAKPRRVVGLDKYKKYGMFDTCSSSSSSTASYSTPMIKTLGTFLKNAKSCKCLPDEKAFLHSDKEDFTMVVFPGCKHGGLEFKMHKENTKYVSAPGYTVLAVVATARKNLAYEDTDAKDNRNVKNVRTTQDQDREASESFIWVEPTYEDSKIFSTSHDYFKSILIEGKDDSPLPATVPYYQFITAVSLLPSLTTEIMKKPEIVEVLNLAGNFTYTVVSPKSGGVWPVVSVRDEEKVTVGTNEDLTVENGGIRIVATNTARTLKLKDFLTGCNYI